MPGEPTGEVIAGGRYRRAITMTEAEPALAVDHLRVAFPTRRGLLVAVREATFTIERGEIRIGGRRVDRLPDEAMRRIRGREVGAIFQDPLTSLNPLYTIGRQLIETIRTHRSMSEA